MEGEKQKKIMTNGVSKSSLVISNINKVVSLLLATTFMIANQIFANMEM